MEFSIQQLHLISGTYSQTSHKQPSKMSSLGGCLWEVVAYDIESKFPSLAEGNCQDLPHVPMPTQSRPLNKNTMIGFGPQVY